MVHSEPIVVSLESGRHLLVDATLHGEEQVSVSLPKFRDLSEAISEIAHSVAAAVAAVKPDGFEVEFGIDATVDSGALTALLVKGSGTANIKVTLKWGKLSK